MNFQNIWKNFFKLNDGMQKQVTINVRRRLAVRESLLFVGTCYLA